MNKASRAPDAEEVTLDAGALIALERGDPYMQALLRRIAEREGQHVVPAGALAQAWRNGSRQARLARLVSSRRTSVVPLDLARALAAGVLCGQAGKADVIDASVVLCAREHRHTVVTTDPDDLRRLAPDVTLMVV